MRHGFLIKMILLVITLGIFAGCFFFAHSFTLTDIRYEGNEIYSDEEMTQMLFGPDQNRNTMAVYFQNLFGKKEDIPFIDRYEIKVLNRHTCEVVVYEKSIVGCFPYMSSYMYFDRDGIIVDNSFERKNGVVLIDGLTFTQVVLYEKLPVDDDEVFDSILTLTNLLKKKDITVDRILYEEDLDAVLYMGNLRVRLGKSAYLEEKIDILISAFEGGLAGRAGTFYLEDYEPGVSTSSFVFRPD